MFSGLKTWWYALGEEGKQNFGVLLAIPPAIFLGLLFIWLAPILSQAGWSRYRLNATFIVDGHTVSTSQTYKYRCTGVAAGKDIETVPMPCQLRGEAMAIDLGHHGKLFVIMNQWNRDHSALAGRDYMITRLTMTAQTNGKLSTSNLPAMVIFRDLNDPSTAEFVDPQHLEAAFGKGVVLADFEVSSVPLAENKVSLKTVLPWLNNPRINAFGREGAAAQLHAFDFKWPPN